MFKKSSLQLSAAALVLGFSTILSSSAHAAFIVYSPKVEKGIVEIESQNAFEYNNDGDDERQHKLEIGYGVTTWWSVALEGEWEKEGSAEYDYTATAIENIFQFTDPGKYWLDAGAFLEYEFAHPSGSADKVEAKLLLEKNLINFSHTANFTIEQEVGDNANENPEWGFAWRSIYLAHPMINPGVEYYAEMNEIGNSGNFDAQEHFLGPVITGHLGHGIHYDLGWLIGLSDGSADHAVKFNIEYEFPI
jgi:hypothetical protein